MMRQWKTFWRRIHKPPLNPQRLDVNHRAFERMFVRFYFKPHWRNVITIVILGSLFGSISMFFYIWTGRFVADEIIQIHLQTGLTPQAASLDPTRTDENRKFALDQPRERTSWSHRLESSAGKSQSEKIRLTLMLAALLLTVVAVDNLGLWVLSERMVYVGQKVQFQMRQRLYDKLHALPMSYHDRSSVGSLMTHLFSDVSGIQQSVNQLLRSVSMNMVLMGVGVVILLSINVRLTGLVLLALPAYGFCYHWFRGHLKVVHENLREREGRLNGHTANRIKNFYLVKSFVRETFEGINFLRRSKPILHDQMTASVLNSLFAIVCGIISGICMVAVLWISANNVRSGQMTLGTLLLFYGAAGHMFAPVASLTNLAGIFHRLCAISQKVMRVLDEPITLTNPHVALPAPASAPEIRFDNVILRYGSSRQPAVKDLSFTLPAGKTLCVMGPSGSGKTTLAKLACRIYDPTAGEVCLDGHDIRMFKIADLRRMTGFVNQEPVIFDGTIRDNIRYGSEHAQLQSMVTAAQYAQIHDFIEHLPERYATVTHERGLTLSGGQKQRVNLARVLLFEPKVLVLDDCTSALDAETESRLIRGFDTVLKGRTALLISHRMSMAMRCDLVLMLDEGQIAEFGPPAELLNRNGPFAKLCDEQNSMSNAKC